MIKVCPFPAANKDKTDYEDDDLESDSDQLDTDDLGIVVALKDDDGAYVTWDDDLKLVTTENLGENT